MVGTLLFNNAVILQDDPVPAFVISVFRATAGLVNGTLIASLSTLTATAIVIFGIGRLRGWDVGWRLPELWWGLAVTLGFWIAMQGVLALLVALSGEFSLHDAWKQHGVGGVLGQLLGNAFVEETLLRGFFLPQFYLKAAQVYRRGTALLIAVLGSTLLFAVLHIPNRLLAGNIYGGNLLVDHLGLLVFGLLFAAVFLITRNLFIAVGLHAIVNEPALIVRAPDLTVYAVWFALTVLVLVTWPLIRRLRVERQQDSQAEE